MPSQNRSHREGADQPLERASLQELRVRRASPVPDARDAYDELKETILRLLATEIGQPRFRDAVTARAFIQAQLDEILRQEKIILNRHERRQLNHDIAATLRAANEDVARSDVAPAKHSLALASFLVANDSAAHITSVLRTAVVGHRNILISGEQGVGKTALLRALCHFIPAQETVVTIEETAELLLDHPRLISLQTHDPGARAHAPLSAGRLLAAAARTRHHRLIIDGLHGAEAYTWLQLANAGARGSMATCLGEHPRAALARIQSLALRAVPPSDPPVIDHVTSAIDLIIHLERAVGSPPRIASATEIAGFTEGQYQLVSTI